MRILLCRDRIENNRGLKVFSDALLSYNVPEGTYHSTMWYLSTPEDLNDSAVSDHIQESIRELVSMTLVNCAMLDSFS